MTERIPAVGFAAPLPIDDEQSLQDVLVDVPDLRPHDLLVEVRAVSVNPVDVKVRASREPKADRPEVLGYDAAGVVREVGPEVTLFAAGDEVFYAGALDRPGTNAGLHAVDERIVGRKPESLGFAEAAALPLTAITAWEGLFDKLRLTRESRGTLLVVGASGGVGSVVLQLAEHLLPAVRVIATSSRPETDEWVRGLGAEATVDHRGDLRAEIADAAPDGVDWIFTMNSEGQLPLYVDVLNPFGEIVAIDDPKAVDVVALKSKALTWHWEFMFARSLHDARDLIEQHRLLDEVSRLVDVGALRTTLTKTLTPIDATQLREAHRLVESGRTIGKVVVAREAD
ncbi:zinc-binding alcohol dehydrogenase family protein [Patulibacter americanus]|uniref:zinc-binding alcohol dehydrogenase family protein n=1 Tax=Patulibacter americanus TaxID=588672 RepID=UPI0003B341E9|nr:zinc-binding alcohol dehydrogenase family protein [Patulibacter americanus]